MKGILKRSAALMLAGLLVFGITACNHDVEVEKVTVDAPIFSIEAGAVESGSYLSISCSTSGAIIYYTTDGTEPTIYSTVYSGAISLKEAVTVKAIAFAGGYLSKVSSASYTIKVAAARPIFSLSAGVTDSTNSLTINCSTSGATIYYTTDGSEPTSLSSVYSGDAINITNELTIKAIAIAEGYLDSDVSSGTYTVDGLIKINGATVNKSVGDEKGAFYSASTTPVTVDSFYMAETETTYADWYEVLSWATSSDRGDYVYRFFGKGCEGSNGSYGALPTSGNSEPVTTINWRNVVVWCNAASEKAGLTPVYYLEGTSDFSDPANVLRDADLLPVSEGKPENSVINPSANGYHLPTVAEWEYAARGGDPTATAWKYTYAGTDSLDDLEDYAVCYPNEKTINVKSKLPNTAGLYDMCGNVMEWTCDSFYTRNRYICGSMYSTEGKLNTVTKNNYYNLLQTEYSSVGFRIIRSSSN